MGIPHLITYLRPYADIVNLAGHSIVIDGPGLAYHVWHICLSTQPQFLNPFEATPPYKLLGETVIRWLDELQAHGVTLYGFLDPLLVVCLYSIGRRYSSMACYHFQSVLSESVG